MVIPVHPLADEVSQRFIVGLSGPTLSESDREVLSQLRPGGVILRAHNFQADAPYASWLETLAKLEHDVISCVGRKQVIFAIDHEGGRINRCPEPITRFPSARHYATRALEVGRAMGIELRSMGFNLSFAPVADIDSNPKNPVIGPRAFGSAAWEVADAACAMVRGLSAAGIIGVGKHFPGHGDTSQDSHEELPSLEHTLELLKERELVPFEALISHANIPALLTSHILFPSLDPDYPVTLSPKVLRVLARDHLRFRGVIISDDMDMKAISENFSDDEVALQAFSAGCDMLLFNHDPLRALRVARISEVLLDELSLNPEEFAEGTVRVQRLFERLGCYVPQALDQELLAEHAALNKSLEVSP